MLVRKVCNVLATLLALMPVRVVCAADHLVTYLPRTGLAKFIVAEWDIRTIRSSINPRRSTNQAHFSDVGVVVSKAADDRVELEGPVGYWAIRILGRGDANHDGIEDVIVCLTNEAKQGTLATERAYLLQKYSKTTPLVALSYAVHNQQCPVR